MKRILSAAMIAASLAIPMSSAHAEHTVCDNEPGDVYVQAVFLVGVDANSPGGLYFCVNNVMVLVRTDRPGGAVCTYFTPTDPGGMDDDVCPIVI